jgi:hypothetical protein
MKGYRRELGFEGVGGVVFGCCELILLMRGREKG